jgi:hypothetical protein
MDNNERQHIIEIWKTIVDVQQHFNDISMKIRGLFITIVIAIAAAQGFLIEKHLSFPLGSVTVLYAIFIPLLGIVATYLFYFIDRHWYHRLLLGAVSQASMIEKRYESELPELGLGAKISEHSPVELKNKFGRWIANRVVSDDRYRKNKRLHSEAKLELLYKSIIALFVVWFVFSFLFIGVFVGQRSLIEFLVLRAGTLICSTG